MRGWFDVWTRSQSPTAFGGAPFTQGGLCSTPINWRLPGAGRWRASAPTEWGVECISAPEGSIGEETKSVKKRAALLHVLAFCFFDHIFGVLRGKQPLSRASRAIGSSGHLFGSFWVSKRNTWRAEAHYKRALPQGGNARKADNYSIINPNPLNSAITSGKLNLAPFIWLSAGSIR